MRSRKLGFGTGLLAGAVLLLGIAVFFNRIVSDLGLGRFDLTEDHLYTVSKGAKNILANLDVPVNVKYYVTPKDEMPAGLKTLQQEVTDKLKELSIASNGKLRFEVVNPKESEDVEKALNDKGIRPFQVQSVDRDALAVKLVYSAIGVGYKDKADEVMPQILPESLSNLEYELLSNVLRITRKQDPVVAVCATKEAIDPQMMQMYLQMGQKPPEPRDNFGDLHQALRSSGYDVRDCAITADDPIPPDAKTLLLLAPRAMNDRQRYEVSQMLRRGGNVVVAAQSLTYDYNPGQRGGYNIDVRSTPLGVNDLLSKYGVRVDDRMLMDSQMATLAIPRTQTIAGMRFQVTEPVQAPMQIRVMGDGVKTDVPITAGVPELLYLWGTRVVVDPEALKKAGLEEKPVLTGSADTWIVDHDPGPLAPADLREEGHETVEHPLLATLIDGTFPDPWEGQDPPAWPAPPAGSEEEVANPAAANADPDRVTEPKPGRLFVIGCSKLFEDMLIQQQGHGVFLLNTVDALTLGDDLISIRSKIFEQRTLGEVSDGKKLTFRMANMALVPVLVIVFALTRSMLRRREEDEYMARYQSSRGGRQG